VLLGNKTLKSTAFENALEELSADLRRYIFLSSEVNNNDLLQFYRGAELFVYPSKAEGFGIPPLEAAALGTPVICSNTSAMSDFTFFGENHIDPNDYKTFLNRISKVLNEEKNQHQLHQISTLVRDKYNWQLSAESLYRLIIQDKALVLPVK
jgi:glycosyltransferase involved in cell wall biosynthesis